MSKFLLLILIVGIFSKPNFLSFAEENSKELELTEMKTTAYTNNMKWVGFSLPSPSVITKIAWSKKILLLLQMKCLVCSKEQMKKIL